MFVQLVLMIKFHRTQTTAKFLLLVAALDSLVTQQAVPPLVTFPTSVADVSVTTIPNREISSERWTRNARRVFLTLVVGYREKELGRRECFNSHAIDDYHSLFPSLPLFFQALSRKITNHKFLESFEIDTSLLLPSMSRGLKDTRRYIYVYTVTRTKEEQVSFFVLYPVQRCCTCFRAPSIFNIF